MKRILLILSFLGFSALQGITQEKFDIVSYTSPKGWKKQQTATSIQLSKEDAAKGTYCSITILKSIPGNADGKQNFDAAWTTLVKEMVSVTTAPEMQPPASENGWEAQSGYAPFELGGEKGIALLVTSTGYEKMVNIIVLTNTDNYESELTAFLGSVDLTKPTTSKPNIATKVIALNPAPKTQAINTGFAFNTTNFDDGWTSTVQEDWVEVTKGSTKVLIHYPKQGTIFPADPEPMTNAAWNILVAPRYSHLKNYRTTYISSYQRVYLAMGYATDNVTNKQVYIVFFHRGETNWMEFVCPDVNSFIQQFKFNPETTRWDSELELVKPLEQMMNYNKFAIAASDFRGEWSSDFTGLQQLYNVYTGQSAGMNMHQSSQTFQFGAGNSYNWQLIVVSGQIGTLKHANVKSSGKFTILNNWQMQFSNMEGRMKKYDVFFSCIKGARLLKMNDANSPGSGIFTVFGKK